MRLLFTHHLRAIETKNKRASGIGRDRLLLIPSTSYVQVRNYTRFYNISKRIMKYTMSNTKRSLRESGNSNSNVTAMRDYSR